MTLEEILHQGVALVFLDSEDEKEPSGMVIGCGGGFYHVYFQVNDSQDFEHVTDFPIKEITESKDFEEILKGAMKLAIKINEGEVEL